MTWSIASGGLASHPVPLKERALRMVLRRVAPLAVPLASFYRRWPLARVTLVAFTGSMGKTTTAACAAAAIGLRRRPSGNNAFGRMLVSLFRIRPWQRFAVIETGIERPGQMDRIAAVLQPDLVVVTAIGSSHGRSFRDLAHIAAEKGRLLDAMRCGGIAILNIDDPHVRDLARRAPGRVITYGFSPDADIRALRLSLDWPQGNRLRVAVEGQELELRSALFGRGMAYAALAALAAAHALGEPLAEAAARIAAVAPAMMRLDVVALPSGAWLIRDEFRSNVETIDAALDLLEEVPGRKFAIMGEINEPPSPAGPVYRRLGGRLARICERVAVVGSRSTHQQFASGARRAGGDPGRFLRAGHDWRRAVEAILEDLRADDVVLVKGRNEQCLARASLALMGRDVRCCRTICTLREGICDGCPSLGRDAGAR